MEGETCANMRIGKKYALRRQIGSGSFGDIYSGVNVISGEEVAVKLESVRAKHPQLDYEARVYKALGGGIGIPFVRWYGTEQDYNALVIDLLGPSLEDLFNFCNRRFSYKTTLLLADQLVCRLEFIHSRGFIHRDIKPDNFLMGIGRRGNQVNVIDFGLAKRFRDPHTHRHIPYREHKNLTGTARYASLNTHLGVEQSRRDDLESLAYVLIYFARGGLPWQGLRAQTKRQKYTRIMESKLHTDINDLTRGLPDEFNRFLRYARELRFDDRPDYVYFRRILRDLFLRQGYHYNYVFDWKFAAKRSRYGKPEDGGRGELPAEQVQALPNNGKEHYYRDPNDKPSPAAAVPQAAPATQTPPQQALKQSPQIPTGPTPASHLRQNSGPGGSAATAYIGQSSRPQMSQYRTMPNGKVPLGPVPTPVPGSMQASPMHSSSIQASPLPTSGMVPGSQFSAPGSPRDWAMNGQSAVPSPAASPVPYNPYQQPDSPARPPMPTSSVPANPVSAAPKPEYRAEVLPKIVSDPLDASKIYFNGVQFNETQIVMLRKNDPPPFAVHMQLLGENTLARVPVLQSSGLVAGDLEDRVKRIAFYQLIYLRTLVCFGFGPYADYQAYVYHIIKAQDEGYLLPVELDARFDAYEIAFLRSSEPDRTVKLVNLVWNRERLVTGGSFPRDYAQQLALIGWQDSPVTNGEVESGIRLMESMRARAAQHSEKYKAAPGAPPSGGQPSASESQSLQTQLPQSQPPPPSSSQPSQTQPPQMQPPPAGMWW